MHGRWLSRAIVATLASTTWLFIADVSPAAAATLLENDRLKIDASALARAAGGVTFSGRESPRYGITVQFARLKLAAEYKERTKLTIQVGGAGGEVVLKDAFAEVTAADPIFVRLGRFKTSVSQETLMSAGSLPFVSRALLSSYVPSRLTGAEVYGTFEAGPVTIQPELGLFQPGTTAFGVTSFQAASGQVLMARILTNTDFGLDIHVGYAGLVFDSNEPVRVVEYDDPLDLAITYKKDRWDLHLEGVGVFDPPSDGAVLAGYLHGGYRFGASDELQWKPMAAYDVAKEGDLTHRLTAGLNLHWWDTSFVTMLDYRFQTTVDQTDDMTPPAADRHSVFLVFGGGV